LGPEVGAVATLAGYPPDVEQQMLLDVSFALDKRGQPLVFESVVIAPRQNLKTGWLKQRALGKLFVLKRPLVVWSAHEFDTARRALLDLESLIEGSPVLRREVRLTSRGRVATHGAIPEITLDKPPATLVFKTRTSGGGRGLTGDDLFVDEAFAAQADQMGAVMPIMLARPGSQIDFTSSACRPESAYLWDLVQRGRAGGGPRMLYAEWCAPPPEVVCDAGKKCRHRRDADGCGCDKPEVIVLAHPAVTRGRIELEKVADLRRTMPEDEFPREIMGWHDVPVGAVRTIPDVFWRARAGAEGAPSGPVAFALSAAWPDAEMGSIAVAGYKAGELYVQVVEYRPGTSWIPARILELRDDHQPCAVLLDEKDPVACEKVAIESLGVELTPLTMTQAGQAYGMLIAAVMGDAPTLRHYDQAELNAAVAGASKRPVGDAHTWARQGPTDISPIVAVTHAAYGVAAYGSAGVFFGAWR
jgi:Holliday junction resolvasome RuvABC endonuclease subunit